MCGGRCCHWGPLIALAIVKWITLSTVFCNTMWWPPESGYGAVANMLGFMALSSLTTFHFFAAMCDGPGFVKPGWKPEKEQDTRHLQYCETCKGYKAPRSHHCRKCGRCVMKMDHHCPWINTCVGHVNHGHFIAFLFFAVCGCLQATISQSMTLYYGLNRSYYHHYGTGREPRVLLSLFTLLTTLFGLGLSIGVVLAVGVLLFFQLRAVWRNQTGIEDWILEKAAYRLKGTDEKFENPYDLGCWRNVFFVIRPGCGSTGDGIDWPLKDGANKYDMTIEQLMQKRDKRNRTREYKVVKDYSGSWFPMWSMGFRVSFHPPCTEEPRIRVAKGDVVRVTRWKKYWLYGDKVQKDSTDNRVRGWFPRLCAIDTWLDEAQIQHRQHVGDRNNDKISAAQNGERHRKKKQQ